MNKDLLKKIGLYAGVLLLFIGLAYGFTPEVLDGKIVEQGDISQWKGMANEAMTYNEANPEDPTAWSNSMFGGMPTTATIDSFEGDWTDTIYDFLFTGRRPASYLLIALIGGFLLMLSLGTSTLIAVGGAIAMAFCSYNFQIITAGHNTKMQAIAYFPWVLAAVIFTYKSALKNSGCNKTWWLKVILGAVLFAFALSFQIKANHIQITYYLAIVILAYILGLFIYLCIDKVQRSSQMKSFFIASGILLVVGCIGIATNANKLIPTYEYSKYTMRGGSELTSESETHNKDGLDLKYATEWSYGIEEMPNLLIPNYNGGASGSFIDTELESSEGLTSAIEDMYTDMYMDMLVQEYGEPTDVFMAQEYEKVAREYAAGEDIADTKIPTYWGPQPFTAGPMYMGAITIFLFVLGLILCKGREKWWLLAAIVVTIFLAWGNHFMWFTKLWFEYAPMYNKFRTVSMALIVLQVAMPMLGFLVLDRIIKEQYERRKLLISGAIALAVTAGFCMICILLPNIAGTYTTEFGNESTTHWLAEYRKDLMTSDASRSLWLILIAAALIALPYFSKTFESAKSRKLLAGCVVVVVLFDLWNIGKRYLNEENFVEKDHITTEYGNAGDDPYNLKDTNLHFRIMDVQHFGSAVPSYYYNCIGGYSAVKMQRYQDLINYYLDPYKYGLENLQIHSMLNAKYIVTSKADPAGYPNSKDEVLENPYAFGNCWYVDEYYPAKDPNEEIEMIGVLDLNNSAVIGNDFEWAQKAIGEMVPTIESNDTISLTYYAPNELRYAFKNDRKRAAIFSEIYYPKGWKAWIEPAGAEGKVVDGRYQPTANAKEVDIFRANWILRGVIIPEGEGQLIMRFEPESYHTGENISRFSSILLILMLLGTAGAMISLKRK